MSRDPPRGGWTDLGLERLHQVQRRFHRPEGLSSLPLVARDPLGHLGVRRLGGCDEDAFAADFLRKRHCRLLPDRAPPVISVVGMPRPPPKAGTIRQLRYRFDNGTASLAETLGQSSRFSFKYGYLVDAIRTRR